MTKIRTIVREDGERLPLIVDEAGIPLFGVTVYTTTMLRTRNLAVNSIKAHLRAICHLERFLEGHGIDLQQRFSEGRIFSPPEIDALAQDCRLSSTAIKERATRGTPGRPIPTVHILRGQERTRYGPRAAPSLVAARVASFRLHAIVNYLDWRVSEYLSDGTQTPQHQVKLEAARQKAREATLARAPRHVGAASHLPREGLNPVAVQRMLELCEPDAPDNPWRNTHTRERNALIVRWFLDLGIRRGELLSIRILNIHFQRQKVRIVRAPDDVLDPRGDQPLVKTQQRDIPISSWLLDATRRYVMGTRPEQKHARRHDFLFVASGSGDPLSLPACNKIFSELRAREPTVLRRLSPHALRHTWNDRFSDAMDKERTSETLEAKVRSYLMGWSETSNTAAIYTRRHVRLRAEAASLKLQQEMIGED